EDRSADALIRLIEGERKIKRHHDRGVARFPQSGDDRIVAQTAAAIHAAGARSNEDDVHSSSASRADFLRPPANPQAARRRPSRKAHETKLAKPALSINPPRQ